MSKAPQAWAGLEVASSDSESSLDSDTSGWMGGDPLQTKRTQGKKAVLIDPDAPWAGQGGSKFAAVGQGKNQLGTQGSTHETGAKKLHSTNSGTSHDDMDIVSESDFDDSAPPPIPHGWEEAFNNVDESSDASIQIFNAHITHLRWTYRCLLAHYNHCVATRRLLSAQKGTLDCAMYTQWASHRLHATTNPSAH